MNAITLFAGLPMRPLVPGDATVSSIETDSRAVRPGSVFFARQGWFVDANAFVGAAIEAGASTLVVTREDAVPANCPIPVWFSEAEDRDLGLLADRFYQRPTLELLVCGVTGTNGKTSVSALLEHVLTSCGERVGVIGTVNHRFEDDVVVARNTTPDGLTIHSLARRWADAGATALVLEVSSHGAALDRIAGVAFDRVGFTNLTIDHLDFHETFEAYQAAKALLFSRGLERALSVGKTPEAVAYLGDPAGQAMLDCVPPGVVCTGVHVVDASDRLPEPASDMRVLLDGPVQASHVPLRILGPGAPAAEAVPVQAALVGRHNVVNAAVALAMVNGRVDLGCAIASLATFPGVPGRFEAPVLRDEAAAWFVDYAHSPDAVAHALEVLRAIGPAPRTIVLGCGGDRDRTKRPEMAAAAVAGAERCIFTADNPRSEPVEAILAEMMAGVPVDAQSRVTCMEDRSAAIAAAVLSDGPVLIAGKGHEPYQEVAGVRFHLDDREELRRAAASLRLGGAAPLLAGWSPEQVALAAGGRLVQRGQTPGWGALRTDHRHVVAGDVFVALRGDRHDGHSYALAAADAGAALLLLERSMDVPPHANVVVVEDTRAALGRLATALLAQARRRRGGLWTVGITGSNGKTTTKQMLAVLLEDAHATPGNWNNHIGLPLTVAQLGPGHRTAVLEMGANQPTDIDELAAIAPMNVAVVTSIGHAHTEGFGGIEGVRYAKAGIVRSGQAETAVLPVDEVGHTVWDDALAMAGCALVTFGASTTEADVRWHRPDAFGPVTLTSGGVLPTGSWTVECPLPGGHNASNLACAWAAMLAGDPDRVATPAATLSNRLAALEMPAGRLQRQTLAGRTVIDDAYNANPSSMHASLELLGQTEASVRVAILGDMLEIGADEETAHREMGVLAARVAPIVWGVGARGQWIAEAAEAAGAQARHFASAEAVAASLDTLPVGATVLLKASRGIRLEVALAPWIASSEKP